MLVFILFQEPSEPFHEYFSRFTEYHQYFESIGEYYSQSELGHVLLECINDETREKFVVPYEDETYFLGGLESYMNFKFIDALEKWKSEKDMDDLIVVHHDEKPIEVNTPDVCSLISESIIVVDEGDDF